MSISLRIDYSCLKDCSQESLAEFFTLTFSDFEALEIINCSTDKDFSDFIQILGKNNLKKLVIHPWRQGMPAITYFNIEIILKNGIISIPSNWSMANPKRAKIFFKKVLIPIIEHNLIHLLRLQEGNTEIEVQKSGLYLLSVFFDFIINQGEKNHIFAIEGYSAKELSILQKILDDAIEKEKRNKIKA